MLAGQPPFTGATVDSVLRQHMTVPPPQVTIARPAVPYAVACALERALAKTPADRFPTASRFVEALIRGGGAGASRRAPRGAARYWRGRADPASARAFARRSGAQFAVVGSIVPAGPDSVRLVATIVDATRNQTVAEVEVRDERSRMERVTDSATVRLLRGFARVRPVGAFRATPFGATSLPALRAFLRGEQQFRRAAWDSAMAHYQEAVGLDSTLALAWRRMSAVRGCGRLGGAGDDLGRTYGLRAGTLNHRLPPRDSLP